MGKSQTRKSKNKSKASRPTTKRKPGPLPAKPVVVESPKVLTDAATDAPTHDAIAAKAYEIWVAKGRPVGQDDLNWIEAEQALRS